MTSCRLLEKPLNRHHSSPILLLLAFKLLWKSKKSQLVNQEHPNPVSKEYSDDLLGLKFSSYLRKTTRWKPLFYSTLLQPERQKPWQNGNPPPVRPTCHTILKGRHGAVVGVKTKQFVLRWAGWFSRKCDNFGVKSWKGLKKCTINNLIVEKRVATEMGFDLVEDAVDEIVFCWRKNNQRKQEL